MMSEKMPPVHPGEILQEDFMHPLGISQYRLAKTNAGRRLFISFTVWRNLIRVISAREMSRKERAIYAKAAA